MNFLEYIPVLKVFKNMFINIFIKLKENIYIFKFLSFILNVII